MNKLILGALCLGGIAFNGILTSRNHCLEAMAVIDEKVAEAKLSFREDSGHTMQEHLDKELTWFIWHTNQQMLVTKHQDAFNKAVHSAINQACK